MAKQNASPGFQPIEVPVVNQTELPGFEPIEVDVPGEVLVSEPHRRTRPTDTTAGAVEKQEN
ncbi:hypothetical protein [Cellulomonas rhizosphaerae]|uniref:Uncharacterized protein n=1 Tax=Cellulomonas rhizosphaerae TaxID=2293719 RepID=A0A413RJI0_9CELL|nr:hypothetical protein [Cellulomonas rhizosphaerae]RHA38739.1 hypothetical protein D1825_13480 [Cellulomonas rhizosphaerae]